MEVISGEFIYSITSECSWCCVHLVTDQQLNNLVCFIVIVKKLQLLKLTPHLIWKTLASLKVHIVIYNFLLYPQETSCVIRTYADYYHKTKQFYYFIALNMVELSSPKLNSLVCFGHMVRKLYLMCFKISFTIQLIYCVFFMSRTTSSQN